MNLECLEGAENEHEGLEDAGPKLEGLEGANAGLECHEDAGGKLKGHKGTSDDRGTALVPASAKA